eukprot:TRINITY_DN3024_c0_g1_i2.p1 TRINITY_DN3024_c0_g1~~TRINITY_DN3024_c0_g1_i2.p1  ORF type:complete len:423 (-),score=133.14 TRINITY_DN3024_c0_g1_i2:63-1331(-)
MGQMCSFATKEDPLTDPQNPGPASSGGGRVNTTPTIPPPNFESEKPAPPSANVASNVSAWQSKAGKDSAPASQPPAPKTQTKAPTPKSSTKSNPPAPAASQTKTTAPAPAPAPAKVASPAPAPTPVPAKVVSPAPVKATPAKTVSPAPAPAPTPTIPAKVVSPAPAKVTPAPAKITSTPAKVTPTPAKTASPSPAPVKAAPAKSAAPAPAAAPAAPAAQTGKPCGKCSKPVGNDVIEAMGKEFHVACFVCNSCSKPIEGRFASVAGQPVCPSCSAKKSAAKAPSVGPTGSQMPAASAFSKGSSVGPAGSQMSRPFGAPAKSTGQMGLFQWVQNRTEGYGLEVKNWTTSWQNGLVYCALLHSYHPNLIDYKSLKPENKQYNINLAYSAADKLGIVELLEKEDFALEKLSMMTQMSEVYKMLNK